MKFWMKQMLMEFQEGAFQRELALVLSELLPGHRTIEELR